MADTLYVCGKDIVPDCTGTYILKDTYLESNVYVREDGAYLIWKEVWGWNISIAKGDITVRWTGGIVNPIGEYNPTDSISYFASTSTTAHYKVEGSPLVQDKPC